MVSAFLHFSNANPQIKPKMMYSIMTTTVAMNNFILRFLHHIAFLSFFDCFSNLNACWFSLSVLSTSNSIFSPRSRT